MNTKSKMFVISTFMIILFTSYVNAICTPAPTLADDIIECTDTINGTFALNDPGGSDIVTLNSVSGNAAYWLDSALGGNPATDGNDTFIAHNSTFFWVLTFRDDDIIKVYDSNFSNVYADTNPGHGVSQRGNDTIYIENSVSDGWILGGNDNDIITIKDSRVSFVVAGYSDIYGFDYTPFDANDTVILDNVDFGEPNYYYTTRPGAVEAGRQDDVIIFKNGGIGYNVTGGHGNDQIIVEDHMFFNPCTFINDIGNSVECGIYGDEPYTSEPSAASIAKHGDDEIILDAGNFSGITIHGGHGSDLLEIHTPAVLSGTMIYGGDDRSINDAFIDRLVFERWYGDINGSQLQSWETIVFDSASEITFLDDNLTTGFEAGTDTLTGLSYGLLLKNDSSLKISHDFEINGNVYNDAIITMQADGNVPGSSLMIENNYSGNNGLVYLDTVLNNASVSISDTLVVKGDTVGTTMLNIHNAGGLGGQTPIGDNEGILIVEVQGYSDDNAFTLELSPLYAGDYAYDLVKGSNGNWYLQSHEASPVPPPEDAIIALDSSFPVHTYRAYSKQLPGPGTGTTCSGPFTYVLHKSVEHGDLILDPDKGSYTYVPDADYNGIDSFSYQITSDQCSNYSNIATVTIYVECASSQRSDGGDALCSAGMLLMLLFTAMTGLYFIRREENRDII